MWTPAALASEAQAFAGPIWRVVESQSEVATMKLVDTLEEQRLLEAVIEASKPPLTPALRGLHYLLAAPFRYRAYPHGSRFRRANQAEGCFYGSAMPITAIAEMAFYRLLFFLDAPGMRLPQNALPHTAFRVQLATKAALDLTRPPLDRDAALWTHPTDYAPCQALADAARTAGIALLHYRSVRDPHSGLNRAVLTPTAFAASAPDATQSWRLFIGPRAVQAFCATPQSAIEFPLEVWAADPRISPHCQAA